MHGERFEKDQRPRPVGGGVEQLDGDAAFIVDDAEHRQVGMADLNGRARVKPLLADDLLRIRRLKIIPENAGAELDVKRREAAAQVAHGLRERLAVDRLVEHDAHAECAVPVPLARRRIDLGGVVELIPMVILLM